MTVGIPSFRSPLPSGFGIITQRTGLGLYSPSKILCISSCPCSFNQGSAAPTVIPSIPGAPLLLLTFLYARFRLSLSSISSNKVLAPSLSLLYRASTLGTPTYSLRSTPSLCGQPFRFSAFNTPASFRPLLETYDCSALPLIPQGTMASADFLQFVVTAAFGFSYFPSARPPRVSATAFLPRNRHIYRTGFGQHWTSCCLAHSSVPVRPSM